MTVYDVDNVTKVYPRQSIAARSSGSWETTAPERLRWCARWSRCFRPPPARSSSSTQRAQFDQYTKPDWTELDRCFPAELSDWRRIWVTMLLGITIASFWWVGQKMTWRAE